MKLFEVSTLYEPVNGCAATPNALVLAVDRAQAERAGAVLVTCGETAGVCVTEIDTLGGLAFVLVGGQGSQPDPTIAEFAADLADWIEDGGRIELSRAGELGVPA